MSSLRSLQPWFYPWAKALVDLAGSNRLYPRVTSSRRSHALQARLYRKFLAGQSEYPVAPPGTSAHEFGLAFDLVVSDMGRLSDLGAIWESWGGVYGGRKDPIHFEAPGFFTPSTSAKRATTKAPADQSLFDQLLNLGVGFLPGIGELQLAADVLRLVPALTRNELLTFISEPSRLIHLL